MQIGLSHLLAQLLFDAKGSYLQIIRAYILGQLYRCLIIVPVGAGALINIAGIAVLMIVFDEEDEIERMKAFGLAAAIGIIMWVASIGVATSGTPPMQYR